MRKFLAAKAIWAVSPGILIVLLAGIWVGFSGCAHSSKIEAASRGPASIAPVRELVVEPLKYADRTTLRTGVFYESAERPLKGCVLYLQGLGDSMRNHDPLFRALSDAGYRVLTYDYMGQGGDGGSGGLMSSTRLSGDDYKQIGNQARWLWKHRSAVADATNGLSCANSPKLVIGWSTGGLAAYRLAYEKWADAVVLIAPGIHPKWMIGELQLDQTKILEPITERTLTRNKFTGVANPHVDPIYPKTPLRVIPFATSLMLTAHRSRGWKIDSSTPGLVFLSGEEDAYVDRKPTIETLKKNAPEFELVSYDGALHELDNEIPEVASDLRKRTIQFFDRVVAGE